MNGPNDYQRIAVVVSKQLKQDMIDYSTRTGRNLTWCVTTLLSKLLRGEINLDSAGDKRRDECVKARVANRGGDK